MILLVHDRRCKIMDMINRIRIMRLMVLRNMMLRLFYDDADDDQSMHDVRKYDEDNDAGSGNLRNKP